MRVSDGVELSWLGQDEIGPKEPSVPVPPKASAQPVGPRVASAIATIFDEKGVRPAEGLTFDLLEQGTRVPLNRKKTDASGNVLFDVERETSDVILLPHPPAGYVVFPAEKAIEAYWHPDQAPGPNLFRFIWKPASDTVKFRVVKGDAKDRQNQSDEADRENKKDFFTTQNLLIIGGVVVGGYLLMQYFSGGGD